MGPLKIPDTIFSGNDQETRSVGRELVRILCPGDVVSLEGELGAGKTQLVKGVAEGMGIDPESQVFSPTFSIINVYEGKQVLYHIDLYRLGEDWDELSRTGIFDVIGGEGVALIEWGDRAKNYLPKNTIRIILKILNDNDREIKMLRGWSN
ncbi:MAG: tRNA (adenosine(37)-N6)-threonylcarbamoyltransferase complex ATPase subunit type 1 TsaE [Deltaproteobacteria bacterium]|nr:tRNA (adenosine(37)-N6)-threonylcarbamoyltransferase complex ATPase subunit type 1 TsaE [Deltaproteobacteria bacterium]NIS77894.1 tRNA (adenosine(37)-N6)-threonylcarbamoyltransferase complex ATPase subunit type 1 TsaE [Deltaproteobacteria bacterium]